MTRATTLAVSLCLLSTLALAAIPTANAAFMCVGSPSPVGGLVGRTYDYAVTLVVVACNETGAYLFDVCVAVFGPAPICWLA